MRLTFRRGYRDCHHCGDTQRGAWILTIGVTKLTLCARCVATLRTLLTKTKSPA